MGGDNGMDDLEILDCFEFGLEGRFVYDFLRFDMMNFRGLEFDLFVFGG